MIVGGFFFEGSRSSTASVPAGLFKQFDESRDRWGCAVKCVATLDACYSLAKASREPGYCRAELLEGDGSTLKIEDGSHPCLAGDVVPNDLTIRWRCAALYYC